MTISATSIIPQNARILLLKSDANTDSLSNETSIELSACSASQSLHGLTSWSNDPERSEEALRVLHKNLPAGTVTSGSPLERLDKQLEARWTKEVLEQYCCHIVQLITSLMENDDLKVQPALKKSLSRLLSKASRTYQHVQKNGDVNIDKTSRMITWQLETFLFWDYLHDQERYGGNENPVCELGQVISNLPYAEAAYDESAPLDQDRGVWLEGRRGTLLECIQNWMVASEDSHRIQVLFGPAGIGKTTLARTVAEQADTLGLLGASYFFTSDDAERRTAEKFFTTIASQLCRYDEAFAQAIGRVLKRARGSTAITKGPDAQLSDLILEPISSIVTLRLQPVIIVVGSLSGCIDADALAVLKALENLVQQVPPVKVVLTTQLLPHLQPHFEDANIYHLQNMEDAAIGRDMRLYLQHVLSQEQVAVHLPHLKNQWHASQEEIELLANAAGSLFIIASAAANFILDKFAYDPATRMKMLQRAITPDRLPYASLDDFFNKILLDASPTAKEHYQDVVGTIVLTQDALPVDALAKLINISLEKVRIVLEAVIFLIGNGNVPRASHTSFLDFVINLRRCTDKNFFIDLHNHHTRIATRCLQVMNRRLKHNIMDLGPPACFMENYTALAAGNIPKHQRHEKIPLELEYACTYFAYHIEHVGKEDVDLTKEIEIFTNEHLLHWLEALSWVGKFDCARSSLLILLKHTPKLRTLLFDGLWFISMFSKLVERSALHTYYSALPFAPTASLLFQQYNKEMAHNLWQVEGGPEKWDSRDTLFGYAGDSGVHRVIFSWNGHHLASQTRKEMTIWQTSDRIPSGTFNGDMITLSEGFSVAAYSRGGNITLYDTTGGTTNPSLSFKPSSRIIALALSSDGTRLAAGLSSGTMVLWDGNEGRIIGSFDNFACDGSLLELSSKGEELAFLSDRGCINLHDGTDGKFIKSLDSQLNHFKLSFSRNGSRLACLGWKDSIRMLKLWDAKSGDPVGDAEDIDYLLAISGDGCWLATGGRSKVRVWNGGGQNILSSPHVLPHYVLPPFEDEVTSLALSHRGSHDILAIGSISGVILYDIQERLFSAMLPLHWPMALAFSPRCEQLAVGTTDGTVHLWDISTVVATTSGPKRQLKYVDVTAFAFTLDGSRLASGFSDGTIKLWNAPCSNVISADKSHSQAITALAFCPEGRQLASGSRDKTVRLQDGRDGGQIHAIALSVSGVVLSLAFSSHLLAIATSDYITLWDRENFRLVHTFTTGGSLLSFSADSSLLASADTANLAVWNVGERRQIKKFEVGSELMKLMFSPDGSRLAAQLRNNISSVFHVDSKKMTEDPERSNPDWLPVLRCHGVVISLGYDEGHGHHLLGRFPERHDSIPVLWIPRHLEVSVIATGPSMYALGCRDGRILLVRPSYPHLKQDTTVPVSYLFNPISLFHSTLPRWGTP